MKLLLIASLTCALLCEAESLRCHMCGNDACSNSTSVACPITSTVCQTVTSVMVSGSSINVSVKKNCSTLLSCVTPLNTGMEWSLNRGFRKEGHNQICCNFQTLAVPNLLANGKQCPACATSVDSLAGTCNSTLSCAGVEDSCFNGTTTTNSTVVFQLGCISRNLCNIQLALEAILGANTTITCGAPWSVSVSALLLAFSLTAQKVLI